MKRTRKSRSRVGIVKDLLSGVPARQTLGAKDVHRLRGELRPFLTSGEPASAKLAAALQRIEKQRKFSAAGRAHFQDLLGELGVDSHRELALPANDLPFWLRADHALKSYRSTPELPKTADVLIIGAGLTGASAAYHLCEQVRDRGWKVVVVDKGPPAGEASGRNGGNFELLPENSVGIYDGLARERLLFLRRCYRHVPLEILRTEAERQASVVLGFALRNRDRLKQIIEDEQIDCDFSPRGWLYLTHTEKEEQAICEEVMLAAEQGQRIELWSRFKVRREFGFEQDYIGRFIPGDGTYHPFKYVCGVLQVAIHNGVQFYTDVHVEQVRSLAHGKQEVRTSAGTVTASHIIVATNAFTSEVFPELAKIRPAQSQIAITEFAPDRCRGRIVTSEAGPVYFNQPRAGARNGLAPLLMGGGADRIMKRASERRRSTEVHRRLLRLRERFYPELQCRPFSTEWVGPMAFTPDQLPAVGFLRTGVVIAAGYNGYGGSYTCAAGQAAAHMVTTGEAPTWAPEDVFSPLRLLEAEPRFLRASDSLWRIAASLCAQLRRVDRQIAEAISFGAPHATPQSLVTDSTHRAAAIPSATNIPPRTLRQLAAFKSFSPAQCKRLLAEMKQCSLPKGALLFAHGMPGNSCFILVSGTVDITLPVRGHDQLLARMKPGAIFGQVAMIEGGVRTATCVAHADAVLLELERPACERLLAGRSELGYRLLAALTQGLVTALRGADRQLMRLTAAERVDWSHSSERNHHAAADHAAHHGIARGAHV